MLDILLAILAIVAAALGGCCWLRLAARGGLAGRLVSGMDEQACGIPAFQAAGPPVRLRGGAAVAMAALARPAPERQPCRLGRWPDGAHRLR